MRSRFLFHLFSSKKKIFFQTEISLYKVLRSATVSRVKSQDISSSTKFDPLASQPSGWTLCWRPQWDLEPAMEGWQLASGRCLNDCWEGLQSAFFWGKATCWNPKSWRLTDMINLKILTLTCAATLWWTASSFNKKLQSFLRLEKNNNKNELSGPHLSKIFEILTTGSSTIHRR